MLLFYSETEKMQFKMNNFVSNLKTEKYIQDGKITEQDFGPYMSNLQKEIKGNWNPPKGNKSKRVKMRFTISQSGKLLKSKIVQSSFDKEVDNAAIHALENSAPFEPLPKEFKGKSVDIEFTFDYNVRDKK